MALAARLAEVEAELADARARHAAREEQVRLEGEQAVEQAVAQMEQSLYNAAAAHERAALRLQQSEANVQSRDATIAELSAELADAREALRQRDLAHLPAGLSPPWGGPVPLPQEWLQMGYQGPP